MQMLYWSFKDPVCGCFISLWNHVGMLKFHHPFKRPEKERLKKIGWMLQAESQRPLVVISLSYILILFSIIICSSPFHHKFPLPSLFFSPSALIVMYYRVHTTFSLNLSIDECFEFLSEKCLVINSLGQLKMLHSM